MKVYVQSRFDSLFSRLICLYFLMISSAAIADEHPWHEQINWHGFASQGFSYTDRNNFLGSSSNGSFKFNEAGLNASWRGNASLHYSAQVLYKQTGRAVHNGVSLDYATIDWRFLDSFEGSAGVRIGRLKNPYGLYNETRDVAATRPSIILPEGIYVNYLRELLHSSDSIGLYGYKQLGEGNLAFNGVFGKPIFDRQSTRSLLAADTGGELKDERAFIFRVEYENGSGDLRTAFSFVDFEADFEAVAGSGFNSDKLKLRQMLFSLAYQVSDWLLIAEYQRRKLIYGDIYGFYPFSMDKPGESSYVQLGYSITPQISAFIRKEATYLDRDDRNGKEFAAATEALPDPIPKVLASDGFARNTVIGVRYAPTYQWSFDAELHQVDGTFWLPSIENTTRSDVRKDWNMLLLQASYRF